MAWMMDDEGWMMVMDDSMPVPEKGGGRDLGWVWVFAIAAVSDLHAWLSLRSLLLLPGTWSTLWTRTWILVLVLVTTCQSITRRAGRIASGGQVQRRATVRRRGQCRWDEMTAQTGW
ncbi:hypothetical protein EG329_009373 [Mollisiaceae sp. DMI_Dod_QoI]|nr:hypothetical protein EG329_009373 [Helotiales sp. DMI_Dod_QoI]